MATSLREGEALCAVPSFGEAAINLNLLKWLSRSNVRPVFTPLTATGTTIVTGQCKLPLSVRILDREAWTAVALKSGAWLFS